MSQVEEFEAALGEVVNAKRLSASKMTKLSEMALKNMQFDTQLVSVLYRTHKSLSTSAKVNSLYVFDAIARAAKSQVNKKSLSADRHTGKGNAATFLSKLQAVLDGLFQDMAAISSSSTKEKTQKILDIWAKGQTFPQPVLTRLAAITQGKQGVGAVTKESSVPPVSTTPPGAPPSLPFAFPSQQPHSITPTIPSTQDAQATLIALLTQAAQASVASSSGSTPNIIHHQPSPPPVPNTALSALNIIQRLSQTAQLHANSGQPSAPPGSVSSTILAPASQSSASYDNNGRPYQENGYSHNRNNDPRRRDQGQDGGPNGHGPPSRGSLRGGFRGRGRGGRSNWGEDREREWGDQGSHRSDRRSRSRSPPRPSHNRRDPRLRSPTRYSEAEPPRKQKLNLDEFGRDIRPNSPTPPTNGASQSHESSPPPQRSGSAHEMTRDPRRPAPAPTPLANVQSPPPPPASTSVPSQPSAVASTSTASASTPTVPAEIPSSSSNPAPLGLDSFNFMTFDFTDPTAWQGLASMWTHTNGTTPTQEELMQYIMMGSMGLTSQFPTDNNANGNQWDAGWQNGSSGYESSYQAGGSGFAAVENTLRPETDAPAASSSGGGKMQKVGDRWMFIRSAPAEAV